MIFCMIEVRICLVLYGILVSNLLKENILLKYIIKVIWLVLLVFFLNKDSIFVVENNMMVG